jgi:hypothetical protein
VKSSNDHFHRFAFQLHMICHCFRLPNIDGTKKNSLYQSLGILTQSGCPNAPLNRYVIAWLGEGHRRLRLLRTGSCPCRPARGNWSHEPPPLAAPAARLTSGSHRRRPPSTHRDRRRPPSVSARLSFSRPRHRRPARENNPRRRRRSPRRTASPRRRLGRRCG